MKFLVACGWASGQPLMSSPDLGTTVSGFDMIWKDINLTKITDTCVPGSI